MACNIFADLCNRHHNQVSEHFHYPHKKPHLPICQPQATSRPSVSLSSPSPSTLHKWSHTTRGSMHQHPAPCCQLTVHCLDEPHLDHPPAEGHPSWWTSELLPPLGYRESRGYNHLCLCRCTFLLLLGEHLGEEWLGRILKTCQLLPTATAPPVLPAAREGSDFPTSRAMLIFLLLLQTS